jgi:hypothetical protein
MVSFGGHGVRPLSNLGEACRNPRYFIFLREPVKRCVSHYQFLRHNRRTKLDFHTWVQGRDNYQTRFLGRRHDLPSQQKVTADQAIEVLENHVEFVGLTERFDESLVLLKSWSNEPSLDIRYRSRNVAPDNRIKKRILSDAATVDMLEQMHQEDAKVYRYARDVIFPRQAKQYGADLDDQLAELETKISFDITRDLGRLWGSAKRNLVYKPLTRHVWKRTA